MRITNEIFEEIYSKNLQGIDLSDLAKEYGTSWGNLYAHFKRRNISYVKGLHRNLKYRNIGNEDYFKIIDTPIKGYILGILMADGWIRSDRNEIGIKLQKSDKHTIELIKKELKIKNKITEGNNNCGITFCSSTIKKDLEVLGLTSGKTYKEISLPNIDYISDFIIGFLDGDGHISIGKNGRIQIGISSLSVTILNQIKEYLNNFNINCKIYCDKRSNKNIKLKDLYSLIIADNPSRLKFIQNFYLKSNTHLNRKYEKALQANTVLTNKLNKC